mmetsp:Transcript_95362/g.269447  ORF Transcript_95362/g.269447 Transcript_95362/m.269447 type:complete len:166 (-) Transcript_95362:72-569(-)|eukprot:CAMPEP_0168378066 /NCGR_PEP_ID=MMETSP0228-20121227/11148_1 /TAXON_ID=133427 /ORGANISM="Protoceratium reticulatum, Strain CCCM 535 (=CCMP 1889)" /LENGTH=165 /DNA_ID=CAMNT_0008391079 /DNA_START=64 /DNA_END=561 /DNA_ORIENTATION=-
MDTSRQESPTGLKLRVVLIAILNLFMAVYHINEAFTTHGLMAASSAVLAILEGSCGTMLITLRPAFVRAALSVAIAMTCLELASLFLVWPVQMALAPDQEAKSVVYELVSRICGAAADVYFAVIISSYLRDRPFDSASVAQPSIEMHLRHTGGVGDHHQPEPTPF